MTRVGLRHSESQHGPCPGECRRRRRRGEIGEPQVAAFSRPGRRDIVALSHDTFSGAQCRFDAAHELGDLVMDRGTPTGSRETEAKADAFASEFLLPRIGVAREYPRGTWTQWETLIEMKGRWRASIQAVIRR